MLKRASIFILILSLCLGLSLSDAFQGKSYDINRASLIGYMLKEHLNVHNFAHKKIDNSLSKSAFNLYLKQLDPMKRFLLQTDVRKLRAYSEKIDDEIISGKIELPEVGAKILTKRIALVEKMVKQILAEDFDFSKDEFIETDPDKLAFCKTEEELKSRWRKILKHDALNQYITLIDDFKKDPEEAQKTIREKLTKNYSEMFSRMLKEKKSEQYDRYFSAIARTFDPHTSYMPPASKEDFEVSMKGSFEGIGAVLKEEDGFIKVESIMPGSPAALQGQLMAGDSILKVAEGDNEPVDLFDMKISDAVRLIRGKKGTEVRLTVKKQDGTMVVIPIIRDVIKIEEIFAKSTILKDESTGTAWGYIKLPSFYRDLADQNHGGTGRSSSEDVKNEIKKLRSENINGLILDLRHNGGGFLSDAVGVAGLFISEGPVVQIKSSSGKMSTLSDDDPEIHYNGPLVIIVDRLSASASEILAGAMQDYGRAVIIGTEHTHGKGTVQMMVNFDDVIPFPNMEKYRPLGALKLTIQKFYRITGESTQYKGVVPDIVLPDKLKSLKIGERYLEFALPWDKVKPVPFKKWPEAIDIKTLRSNSIKRVQADQDFLDILKESEKIKAQQAKTLQPLNIDIARKERAESTKGTIEHHAHANVGKKEVGQISEDEKKNLWVNELKKDPYVKEAISVLKDMTLKNSIMN